MAAPEYSTTTSTQSGFSIQPDQMVAESEYNNKQWYLANARWICGNYNPAMYTFGGESKNGYLDGLVDRWASRTMVWYSYYAGKQNNTAYSFMSRDERNVDLPIRLYQDQTIPSIIKYMEGYTSGVIKAMPKLLSAIGISSNIVSTKTIKQNIAKWMLDYAEFVDEVEQYGILFEGKYKFKDESDLTAYFEENHKEFEEQIYEWMALDSLYTNKWKDIFNDAARDIYVTGFGMIRIFVRNGKVCYKRVPPEMSIWDNSIDSRQNRGGRFAGELYQLTFPQIAERWGKQLTQTELAEIQVISKDNRYQQYLNTMMPGSTLVWWQQTGIDSNRLPQVMCSDVEWLSMKCVGGEGEEKNYITTKRKATIIGNKWIVDWGESENIIESKENPSDTELSFKVCTPDMLYGYPVGITERLYRLVDLRSAYMTKMIDLVARSKGKGFIIHSQNLPEGLRSPEVIADLSRIGMTVINTADADSPDGSTNNRLVEPVDMTLDPTVIGLLQVTEALKAEMEDIVNVPRGVRGSPKGYQSFKTAELNRAQSTQGIANYYEAIEDFFLNIVDYGAETAKVMVSKGDVEDLTFVIGDKAVKYLQSLPTKELSFSKLRILIQFDDLARQTDRDEILQAALQAINSQQLDFFDFFILRSMKSVRAMENYLGARMKQKKAEAEEQQMNKMAMQQQQMMVNAESQENLANTQVEGNLQAQQMKNDAALEMEMLKQENQQQ